MAYHKHAEHLKLFNELKEKIDNGEVTSSVDISYFLIDIGIALTSDAKAAEETIQKTIEDLENLREQNKECREYCSMVCEQNKLLEAKLSDAENKLFTKDIEQRNLAKLENEAKIGREIRDKLTSLADEYYAD